MIDYTWIYEEYTTQKKVPHMERFHILLFLLYCQTRNIPIDSFKDEYDEYKKVADIEDLSGVTDFLQSIPPLLEV